MEKVVLHWRLNGQPEAVMVERYCHNCGRTVWFVDSKKRRHNANGKNIYEYAIYKCARDHTWNRILSIQKASDIAGNRIVEMSEELSVQAEYPGLPEPPEKSHLADVAANQYENEPLNITDLKKNGIHTVEIILDHVTGKWRLDKVLALQILHLSRTQLEKQIRDGMIRLDGEIAKPGSLLKPQQVITINL